MRLAFFGGCLWAGAKRKPKGNQAVWRVPKKKKRHNHMPKCLIRPVRTCEVQRLHGSGYQKHMTGPASSGFSSLQRSGSASFAVSSFPSSASCSPRQSSLESSPSGATGYLPAQTPCEPHICNGMLRLNSLQLQTSQVKQLPPYPHPTRGHAKNRRFSPVFPPFPHQKEKEKEKNDSDSNGAGGGGLFPRL